MPLAAASEEPCRYSNISGRSRYESIAVPLRKPRCYMRCQLAAQQDSQPSFSVFGRRLSQARVRVVRRRRLSLVCISLCLSHKLFSKPIHALWLPDIRNEESSTLRQSPPSPKAFPVSRRLSRKAADFRRTCRAPYLMQGKYRRRLAQSSQALKLRNQVLAPASYSPQPFMSPSPSFIAAIAAYWLIVGAHMMPN